MSQAESRIPIIDLFAGPGGLGEGFSAFRKSSKNPFRIGLSIEKDPAAHATLMLRAFFRRFGRDDVPDEYYQHLRGELGRVELLKRFKVEAGASNTLSAVIAACRAQIGTDAESLDRLEAALAQAGYSPVFDEDYSRLHLRVVDERLFDVCGDFPRLTDRQLATGVPPGVGRVEYEVDLAGFDHHCVAHQASEASGLSRLK
jgi:hypothetical protein